MFKVIGVKLKEVVKHTIINIVLYTKLVPESLFSVKNTGSLCLIRTWICVDNFKSNKDILVIFSTDLRLSSVK